MAIGAEVVSRLSRLCSMADALDEAFPLNPGDRLAAQKIDQLVYQHQNASPKRDAQICPFILPSVPAHLFRLSLIDLEFSDAYTTDSWCLSGCINITLRYVEAIWPIRVSM